MMAGLMSDIRNGRAYMEAEDEADRDEERRECLTTLIKHMCSQ